MQAAAQKIAANEGATRIGYQRTDLVAPIAESAVVGGQLVCVDDRFDAGALEQCQIGLSGCFAIVAQTGSVVVTSKSTGGRALTVLPPHHVVLATADQLWTNLPVMWERFAASTDRQGSMLSIISGPSRTGDIERILVLGAHGPKKLTIILEQPAA